MTIKHLNYKYQEEIAIKGIYKITNTVNNKCYIGQSNNIKRRWVLHRKSLNAGRHHSYKLQNAWNKYGESNFKFEVIEELNYKNIDYEEMNYIKEYDSKNNGYNVLDSVIDSLYIGNKLRKPNQLISMDRSCFSRYQHSVLNKILKIVQDGILIYGYEGNDFEIRIDDILCGISRSNKTLYKNKILKLSEIKIKSLDTMGFKTNSIFESIEFDETKDSFFVVIDKDIHSFYLNGYKTLGEYEDQKQYYTNIDLEFQSEFTGADASFYLLEYVARYINFSNNKKTGGFSHEMPLNVFKSLIGLGEDSYKRISEFKRHVINKIESDFLAIGVKLNIEIIGRKNKSKKVKININSGSKIKNWMQSKNENKGFYMYTYRGFDFEEYYKSLV